MKVIYSIKVDDYKNLTLNKIYEIMPIPKPQQLDKREARYYKMVNDRGVIFYYDKRNFTLLREKNLKDLDI